MPLSTIYQHSLGLLTDLYQLTMANGYWKSGRADREAVFHLTYRTNPFDGGYAIACGLHYVVDWLAGLRFTPSDVEYLATLTGTDKRQLFENDFLSYLERIELCLDVDATAEGTVVFPHEPLVRVRGPLLQCQLVETGLLNIINFQTLIATKSARICDAAGEDDVLEFGLRRAQGIDGGLSAARAAYIGGCAATSNVLAGKVYGIPVRGTHAHSWVMSFDNELESFAAYADAMPNNCVFLVDTFDTIEGVHHAVEVGRRLRERGFEMTGIRLDSGDLAALSIQARMILDDAGFANARIVASNDLDEYSIQSLKAAGARISIWGVGTRLVTGDRQPALGGVYKLSAIRDDESGRWQYKVKLSNDPIKMSNPGVQQVRRLITDNQFVGDVIYDEELGMEEDSATRSEDLLASVFRAGQQVYDVPTIQAARQRTTQQLAQLPPQVRHMGGRTEEYSVTLDRRLQHEKDRLIEQAARSET